MSVSPAASSTTAATAPPAFAGHRAESDSVVRWTLGYWLKYPTAFGDTHLGPIGRRKPPR